MELELRIARLEIALSDLKHDVDLLLKQHVALQAQLDHLNAKLIQL